MAVNRSSGAAARELATALRDLRGHRSLTTRAVADRITVSAANISHWERGARLPSDERLCQLLDALDASADERERLLGLRRQAEGPGQFNAGQPGIDATLAQLIDHERAATRITVGAPLLIPGLLQTSDYARAIMSSQPDSELRVALRSGRRDIITRAREPVELVALIDSGALTRPVAPLAVMRDQLQHVLDLGRRPNVTIQVVSSTFQGYHPMLAGPSELIEFAKAAAIVLLEHHRSSAFLWEEEDVAEFVEAAELIRTKVAMTPARSAEVIAEIAHDMTETETI